MRESKLERESCAYLRSLGCLTPKMKERGWPDRLVVTHKSMFYIEFKQKGLKPDKYQAHVHKLLDERGARVYVVDSPESMVLCLFDEGLQ